MKRFPQVLSNKLLTIYGSMVCYKIIQTVFVNGILSEKNTEVLNPKELEKMELISTAE